MRIPVFFTALFIALGLAESAAALILVLAPAKIFLPRPAAPARAAVRIPEPEEFVVPPRAPAQDRVRVPEVPESREDGCLRCAGPDLLLANFAQPVRPRFVDPGPPEPIPWFDMEAEESDHNESADSWDSSDVPACPAELMDTLFNDGHPRAGWRRLTLLLGAHP